eukprot:100917-Rhodomonas_salina.1
MIRGERGVVTRGASSKQEILHSLSVQILHSLSVSPVSEARIHAGMNTPFTVAGRKPRLLDLAPASRASEAARKAHDVVQASDADALTQASKPDDTDTITDTSPGEDARRRGDWNPTRMQPQSLGPDLEGQPCQDSIQAHRCALTCVEKFPRSTPTTSTSRLPCAQASAAPRHKAQINDKIPQELSCVWSARGLGHKHPLHVGQPLSPTRSQPDRVSEHSVELHFACASGPASTLFTSSFAGRYELFSAVLTAQLNKCARGFRTKLQSCDLS